VHLTFMLTECPGGTVEGVETNPLLPQSAAKISNSFRCNTDKSRAKRLSVERVASVATKVGVKCSGH